MRNFAELYCEHHHLPIEGYARAVFWRCLHRRALPFAPIILLLRRHHFAADYELILGVGAITSRRLLNSEVADFDSHPLNHGMLRRRLKLRLSVKRLMREVTEVLPSNAGQYGSETPFEDLQQQTTKQRTTHSRSPSK